MRRELIRFRRGTAAAWVAANPILDFGEPGFEADTLKIKVGDGSTTWNLLDYLSGAGSGGGSGDVTSVQLAAALVTAKDRANHTGTQVSTTISDFTEAVQDAVSAMLVQGSGVTLSYNDAGNSLTVTSLGGGGITDPEVVRDTIGTALVGVGVISVALNDSADTITITSTATTNATDAALRDRSTHTGTQPVGSIAGFDTAALNAVAGQLSMRPIAVPVVTGNESRPAGSGVVFWIGGATAPLNMSGNDVWLSTATPAVGDTTAPGTPSGLSASSVTATSFVVSWTAPSDNVGVTGYEVRVDGVSYATPTAASQAITGRTAATAYAVDVRARDAAGNWSAWSSPLTVTTGSTADTTPPGVPTSLTSSGVTASQFTVSWTAPSDNVGVTGYEVRVNGTSYSTPSTNNTTVTGRAPSTTYSVDVRARDAAGNWSAYSGAINVTTGAAAATHKVFGATAPASGTVGTISQYGDGPSVLYVANAFYSTTDGWVCKGARVWVPAGATNLGTPIIVRAWKAAVGSYIADYDAPTQSKTIASPVAGAWNEVTWDSPFSFNRVGHATTPEKVWIGFNWNGNYLHSPGVNDASVQAADASNLYLSENPTGGGTAQRAVNRAAPTGTGHVYYSVDIIADGT